MNALNNIKSSGEASKREAFNSFNRESVSPSLRMRNPRHSHTSSRDGSIEDHRNKIVPELSPEDWSLILASVGHSQDKDAFAKVFHHFGPRVKSLMLKYGSNNELAEEIVQETFVIVWRKAALFDADKAAASTWIFTIARNKRIDVLRRQNRPEPDMNDPAMAQDPIPNSEEFVSGKERALAVQRAIAKLPEDQREVLHRSYFSEETHREIAKNLKTPLGTVKSRLRLALSKLRTLIDEDIGEGSI